MICEHEGCPDPAVLAFGAGGLHVADGASAHLRVCVAHAEAATKELLSAVLHAHNHDHPLAAPASQKLVANRLSGG
jgi:hypothetical protein